MLSLKEIIHWSFYLTNFIVMSVDLLPITPKINSGSYGMIFTLLECNLRFPFSHGFSESGYSHAVGLERYIYFRHAFTNNIREYSTCFVMCKSSYCNLPAMTFPKNIPLKGISATPGSNPKLWILDLTTLAAVALPRSRFEQDLGNYHLSLRETFLWVLIEKNFTHLQQQQPCLDTLRKHFCILFYYESSSDPKMQVKSTTDSCISNKAHKMLRLHSLTISH